MAKEQADAIAKAQEDLLTAQRARAEYRAAYKNEKEDFID